MKKVFFLLILFVAAAGGFYLFGPAKGDKVPDKPQVSVKKETIPRVEVIELEKREAFRRGYSESSTLDAVEEVIIYPKVSSRLFEIRFSEGDSVKKGEVVAVLDHRDMDAQIASIKAQISVAKAKLESAMANFKNAENERKRYRSLVNEGYATTQQLETKETAYLQARSEVSLSKATIEQYRAELQKQQVMLSEYFLESPMEGKVMEDYSHSEGNMITPSTPVLHIAQVDELKAVIKAPQVRAVLFHEGMDAELEVESLPDMKFKGKISMISPMVDSSSRTSTLEVSVENKEGLLKPGMFSKVFIIEEEVENAIVIPLEAVVEESGQKFVFRVTEGVAHKVNIQPGIEMDRQLQVREGLNEGDLVIISGGNTLSEGDRVSVVD